MLQSTLFLNKKNYKHPDRAIDKFLDCVTIDIKGATLQSAATLQANELGADSFRAKKLKCDSFAVVMSCVLCSPVVTERFTF